jgi:hypothetical protein
MCRRGATRYFPFFTLIALMAASWFPATSQPSGLKKDKNGMEQKVNTVTLSPVKIMPTAAGLRDEVRNIFSVPFENAVGTIDLDNAVTILQFRGDKIDYGELRKNFLSDLNAGEMTFIPLYNTREFLFSQNSGATVFDFHDKTFNDYYFDPHNNERIKKFSVWDKTKNQFVFDVSTSTLPGREDSIIWADEEEINYKVLRIIQLGNERVSKFSEPGKFKTVAQMVAGSHNGGYSEPWCVHEKLIFVYASKQRLVQAYDGSFTKTSHPFCSAVNAVQRHFGRIWEILIHPALPFGLVLDRTDIPGAAALEENRVWVVRWKEADEKKRVTPLPVRQMLHAKAGRFFCGKFDLSPEGSVIVFRDLTNGPEAASFWAMRIDADCPSFLGTPFKLEVVHRDNASPQGTAWISKPLSFVLTDGLVLYKWDFNKNK